MCTSVKAFWTYLSVTSKVTLERRQEAFCLDMSAESTLKSLRQASQRHKIVDFVISSSA